MAMTKYANLKEEKSCWRKGYRAVVGLDEAGRGPIAGPVVAAAVMLKPNFKILSLKLKDSKKLTARKREDLYGVLTNSPGTCWGVGLVSEKIIDKINILQATKLAMLRAIADLKIKNKKKKIDFLISDGNMKLDSVVLQKSIVKGDEKVFSCAAASILAKVTRDRLMEKFDKKYPDYGFLKHKGYPTAFHIKKLEKHGPCSIHRKTFWPVRKYVKI
jgi:ribonuclease HII